MYNLEPKYDIIIKCKNESQRNDMHEILFGDITYNGDALKTIIKAPINLYGKNDKIFIRMQHDSLYFPAFTYTYDPNNKCTDDDNNGIDICIKCGENGDARKLADFMHSQFDNLQRHNDNDIIINCKNNIVTLFIDAKLNIRPSIVFISDFLLNI